MPGDVLTTSEAARILGASRQHVADLADRGELPSWRAGTHRRFRKSDVDTFAVLRAGMTPLSRMSVSDRRSLAYGCLLASKLVTDTDRVLERARRNLANLLGSYGDGAARPYLGTWSTLLDGPVETILEVLTSTDERSIDLRHTSPFAGVLSQRARLRVIQAIHDDPRPARAHHPTTEQRESRLVR